MLKKIKNFFRLENLKNVASILTGFSLFIGALFLVLVAGLGIYDDKADTIKVMGEASIKIPEIKEFNVNITGNKQLVQQIIDKIKNELNSNFNNFNLQENLSSDYYYNYKNIYRKSIIISFDKKENEDLFRVFISNNFSDEIHLSEKILKNDSFEVDDKALLQVALENAKSKAEDIAKERRKDLSERVYDLKEYATQKNGDSFSKSVEVTYKLR